MSRFFVSFLFLCSFLYAQVSWDSEHIFSLKKDELGIIYFYEIGKNRQKHTYRFDFRWTLHDGKKVVILSKYRNFPNQHILYFDAKLNAFKQNLLNNSNQEPNSYLLLQMDKFHEDKKEISFLAFVKDRAKKFEVKYIDPKRTQKQ